MLPFPYHPIEVAPERSDGDRPELVLFHPSNLGWGITDPGARRNSTKGNDRFLRALAHFAEETSHPLRVIALNRGPDREVAHELVTELGLADIVEWRASLTHPEFYATIRDADVVVDQFDVGGMGGITWESMALGTPVLAYLHPGLDRLTSMLRHRSSTPTPKTRFSTSCGLWPIAARLRCIAAASRNRWALAEKGSSTVTSCTWLSRPAVTRSVVPQSRSRQRRQ